MTAFWRSRVFTQILVRFLLSALVPLLVLSGIALHIFSGALQQHIRHKLIAISDGRAALIAAELDSMAAFVTERSVSPMSVEAFARFGEAFKKAGVRGHDYRALEARYRAYFQQHIDIHDYLHDLLFVSREGDIIFTTRKERDLGENIRSPDLAKTALAELVGLVNTTLSTEFSGFDFYPPSNCPALFIAAPVFGPDRLLGTMVAQIKPEVLRGFSEGYAGLPESGEIEFAKTSGDELVFTTPLRFAADAALRLRLRFGAKTDLPMQAALRGETGVGLSTDYRGELVLARWQFVPRLNWGMVVKADTDDIFASLRALEKALWVLLLLTTLLITKLAFDSARAIAGPISALRRGAEIVGRGDFDYKTRLELDNEIGDLSRAFDKMTEDLKTQTASRSALEKEMAERVRAERELERQNLNLKTVEAAVLNILEDVAESKAALERQNQDLEAAKSNLERSNRELEEFAYIVSHDLKAPLRGISSLSTWLEADYADSLHEEGRHQLRLLKQRAVRMDDLINGILQYSRIHRMQEDRAPADLDRLVDEALAAVDPPPGVRIVRPGPLPKVDCSPTRIRQVFQNLLDNAVKHLGRPTGQVRVLCEDKGGHWQFCVEDDGPGIARKNFQEIFKIFHPVATPGNTQGTGIGLALVQKAVTLHAGKVWVESQLGAGSRFFFTLPKSAQGGRDGG